MKRSGLLSTGVRVVSGPTVRLAIRTAIAAILLGALVAVLVDMFFEPSALTVAAVVAVGVLVSAAPVLGDKGSWVPTAALFVLVLGQGDSVTYTASYAGLVLIGTMVSVLVPQVPTAPMAAGVTTLRAVLCEQLESLAAGLEQQELPTNEDGAIGSRSSRAAWCTDRPNCNGCRTPDTGRPRGTAPHYWSRRPLRPTTVDALRVVAGALASQRPGGADAGRIAHAWAVVATLTDRLGEVRSSCDDGLHVASNIVHSLRRVLQSLERSGDPTPT